MFFRGSAPPARTLLSLSRLSVLPPEAFIILGASTSQPPPGARDALRPALELPIDIDRFAQLTFQLAQLRRELLLPGHGQRRSQSLFRGEAVGPAFRNLVEERVDLVELFLRDVIKFVIMTPGAGQGHAQPDLAGGNDPVHHILGAVLLIDDASLDRDPVVSIETRSEALLVGSLRQQIPGQLFDGELIEGLVAVVGVDHPVTPDPVLTLGVVLVAIGVSVAGEVKPMPSQVLPVGGLSKEMIHHARVGPGVLVGEKVPYLLDARRQTCQVKTHLPNQALTARLWGRLEAFVFEAGEDKPVNWIDHSPRIGESG